MIKKYIIKKYVILILKNNESKKEICDINFKKLNLKIKNDLKKLKIKKRKIMKNIIIILL